MTIMFWRAAGAAGVVGSVVLGVALLLPGPPVTTAQPVADIAHMMATRHVTFALSTYLAGVALMAMCVFAASLHHFLTAAGFPAAGLGAASAVIGAFVLIVVGMSASTGLILNQIYSTPAGLLIVRTAVDTGNVIIELAKFAIAGAIVCVVAGAPHAVGGRIRITGVIAIATLLLSALPPLLTTSGIGQLGGPVDLIGSLPALLWLIALSGVITARTFHDSAPRIAAEAGAATRGL